MLSIQAVKGGVDRRRRSRSAGGGGREAHDPIGYDPAARRFTRPTNRAGGIEGGMTNGEIVRVLGYLKPLATLPQRFPSVDLVTKEPFAADVERTDTVPIVAAGVVGEAMAALVLGRCDAREVRRRRARRDASETSTRTSESPRVTEGRVTGKERSRAVPAITPGSPNTPRPPEVAWPPLEPRDRPLCTVSPLDRKGHSRDQTTFRRSVRGFSV